MGNSHRVLQSSLISGPPRSTPPCGFPLPQRIENERKNKLYLCCPYSHWRLVKLGFTFLKLKIEMRNHCGCVLTIRKHKGIFRKYTKQEVKKWIPRQGYFTHNAPIFNPCWKSHLKLFTAYQCSGIEYPIEDMDGWYIYISPYIQNPL